MTQIELWDFAKEEDKEPKSIGEFDGLTGIWKIDLNKESSN